MRRDNNASLLLDATTATCIAPLPPYEAHSPQLLWLPPDPGTMGLMTASPYAHAPMLVHGMEGRSVRSIEKSKEELSLPTRTAEPLWSSATSNGRGFKGTFGESLFGDRRNVSYKRSMMPTIDNSKYRGVYATQFGTWRAEIELNGKRIPLGTFTSEEDAAECFDKVTVQCFGSTDIDCLNFHVPPALAAAWLSEPLPKALVSALRQADLVERKHGAGITNTYRHIDVGGKKKMKR